ncbi:MAG: hypothetical protein ABI175_28535, partial [Polyangiales bacterium]
DATCEAILLEPMKSYKAYVKGDGAELVDGDEAPGCTSSSFTLKQPKPPWTDAGVVCFHHQHSLTGGSQGQTECSIAVATDKRWWTSREIPTPPDPPDPPHNFERGVDVFDAFVFDAAQPMLVVRLRAYAGDEQQELVTVCRTTPKRACSEPMVTSGEGWKMKPVKDGADLDLVKESGEPPADELGTITTLLKF